MVITGLGIRAWISWEGDIILATIEDYWCCRRRLEISMSDGYVEDLAVGCACGLSSLQNVSCQMLCRMYFL